ncbi:MAG: hypothetical protein ABL889_08075 [Terricaulis sp.]
MIRTLIGACLAVTLEGCATADFSPVSRSITAPIAIETLPPSIVVVRDVQGDYSQHGAVGEALLREVSARYSSPGLTFGEYPQDPDAIGIENVRWRLGVYLIRGDHHDSSESLRLRLAALPQPTSPYLLRIDDPMQAAVFQTTLGNSRDDGLALFGWLAEHNLVQIGPTRMEFLDNTGLPNTPVRIVVPIRNRTWEQRQPR